MFIFVMLLTILVDYWEGIQIHRYLQSDPKRAKRHVIYSIVFNLGLLCFFKYFDFFAVLINNIVPGSPIPLLKIALPIGISFYTFQTMSYTIDVYRKDAAVAKDIIPFATYVSLFPQLIAGPIVRYTDVENDLSNRHIRVEDVSYGIERFVIGLSKKVLLANQAGNLYQNLMLIQPLSTMDAWLSAIAYAFQVYFDFSAYSDMAIGLGRMFGFHFLENFNYPYIANTITQFWRRWHISLSTWFKDYVYIPLGGNRVNHKRLFFNIICVWSLTGLWHGARINFVIWGLYFGLLLWIEKVFLLKYLLKLPKLFQHLYTIVIILIGWIIFASSSLNEISSHLYALIPFNATWYSQEGIYQFLNYRWLLAFMALASTPFFKQCYERYIKHRKWMIAKPFFILALLILSIAYLVSGSYNPFLYFRF
ncbi:MAG: MBOAT family O-acyltransferase [Erysipelotrichaceae bacterium]